jgi:uncharacterized protein (UPF0264 family)
MTGLLVSVRSAAEAETALAGGADLIDVKEPARGALGAADSTVWRAVAATVAGRVPTSVALGELLEFGGSTTAALTSIQLAKLGLAGCCRHEDWSARWHAAWDSLPEAVAPVAVIYADWPDAAAPAPDLILDRAVQWGCRTFLFDTFDKTRGNLIQHLSLEQIARLACRARQAGGRVVLGGSLDADSAERLLPLEPDYIAVRGAVCRHSRTGAIDRALVARLARVVHAA